jgi:hypothetical protein
MREEREGKGEENRIGEDRRGEVMRPNCPQKSFLQTTLLSPPRHKKGFAVYPIF